MKKLIGLFAAFAFAVATVAVVNGTASTVSAETCTNGSKYTDFVGSYSGRDTMTVTTKDSKKLCKDVAVNFASFKAPDNYNGQGFKNNPTALPQSQFYNKTVILKKGTTGKTTVTVQVPDACTNYQIDAYLGAVQTKITTSAGFIDTNAIVGKLFQRTKTDCSVPPVDACNTVTGVVEKVAKGQENVAPHSTDQTKCKDIPVCDLTLKKIVTIKAAAFDSSKYSKDLNDAACKPAPNTVNVCDTTTGKVVNVTEEVSKDSRYTLVDDEACQPPEEETPEVLASTGPTEAISALFGVGSLAGAGTAYVRSRLALRK